MKCKKCGKDIKNGSTYCIYCGKDQRNFFVKHTALSITCIVLLVSFLFIFNLCIFGNVINNRVSDDANKSKYVSNNVTDSPKADNSASANTDGSKANDVDIDGLSLSVTKVEKASGNDFDTPKDGNEFVIVYVKLQNKRDNIVKYEPSLFKLQNSKGQIVGDTFTTINENNMLGYGSLTANGEVEGSIAFEAPKNDNNLILIFQETYNSKKVSINLKAGN